MWTKLATALAAIALAGSTGCKQRDRLEPAAAATASLPSVMSHDPARDVLADTDARIQKLEARYALASVQPAAIDALATTMALSDDVFADIHAQADILQMRLDDARAAIDTAEAAAPAEADDTRAYAEAAMARVDEARKTAWDALEPDRTVVPST